MERSSGSRSTRSGPRRKDEPRKARRREKQKVQLVHWNANEAKAKASVLEAVGYAVTYELPAGPTLMTALRQNPPDAFVIDLTRMPAQGRDLGVALRKSKATRTVPLVFVEGDLEKVARVREILPDAVYTSWKRIRGPLKKAMADSPSEMVVPKSVFAAYEGAPLVKKLGIKAGTLVVLVGAPKHFERTLGALPEGAKLRRRNRGERDLTLWFTRTKKDVEGRIGPMINSMGRGDLWAIWPKKDADVPSDLTQGVVRKIGLGKGIVDYKVCKIDETWAGLQGEGWGYRRSWT